MFLLVPAYPGCPGSKAVKRSSSSLLLLFVSLVLIISSDNLMSRDVKTVYFSEPVCRNRFLPVTERPIVSGIVVTGRACYQSIACCFTAAVARIPDARTPTPRNKGQWHI